VTSFVPQHRMEPPRAHVTITSVDTVKLTAVGLDTRNMGPVSIDLSVHNSQTVIYPREGEEWFLTKINDIWVLDKKGGFGNEGLLREARPGDQVTVTDGNYVLDAKTTQITGPTTFESPVTANSTLSVWGATDLGQLDSYGNLYMHGYHIFSQGGQIQTGNLFAEQIVGTKNAFFDKNLQADTMHCIKGFTTGRIDAYGDVLTHGYRIDTNGGNINCQAIDAYNYMSTNVLYIAGFRAADSGGVYSNSVWVGNAHMAVDGFGIGNAWMNRDGHFTPLGGVDYNGCYGSSASFGGMLMNGGGITTGWRNIDAGFGWMWAGGFVTNICEERFKRDITPIEESQLDTVLAAPLYNFRYDPEVINNVAPEVSSVPEAPDVGPQTTETPDPASARSTGTSTSDPDLINSGVPEEVAEAWRFGPMADDLPEHMVGETSIGKGPDLGAMVNTLWGAVQELSGKLDAANEKIAALTTRLEAVEARS